MTQVTLGSEKKKKKNSPGCMPRTPLEAYAFDARFGKRSVFILDPRLLFVLFCWIIRVLTLLLLQCAVYISTAGCHFGTRTGQLKGCKPEHHTSQPHGLRVRESIEGRVGSWPTSLVANSLVSNRFWGSRNRILWGGRKHGSPKNACFK